MSSQDTIQDFSQSIREKALSLGFADCGFSRAQPLQEDGRRLKDWLSAGHHAGMQYMEHHFEKRTDPARLVEGAVSVISLLCNYYTDRKQEDPAAPLVSIYAFGKDYHQVMKEKLHRLLDFICSIEPEARGRVFVDSAPVLDRAWARNAGLGWIGKNSNLISRKFGSYVFIGEIILNIPLDYNQFPENDFCGNCTRCIDACPTGAILVERTVDAELCISYQTIENQGEIDAGMKGKLAQRIFGCDICQDVCPWNRKAIRHKEPDFEPAPGLLEMTREQWAGMKPETFGRFFNKSAIRRAGYDKVMDTFQEIEKSGKNIT